MSCPPPSAVLSSVATTASLETISTDNGEVNTTAQAVDPTEEGQDVDYYQVLGLSRYVVGGKTIADQVAAMKAKWHPNTHRNDRRAGRRYQIVSFISFISSA